MTREVGVRLPEGENGSVAPGGCRPLPKRRQPNMRYFLAPAVIAALTVVAAFAADFQTFWP